MSLSCGAQHRPVVRIVVAQERFVQPSDFEIARNVHRFAVAAYFAQRILTTAIHRGRGCHG